MAKKKTQIPKYGTITLKGITEPGLRMQMAKS